MISQRSKRELWQSCGSFVHERVVCFFAPLFFTRAISWSCGMDTLRRMHDGAHMPILMGSRSWGYRIGAKWADTCTSVQLLPLFKVGLGHSVDSFGQSTFKKRELFEKKLSRFLVQFLGPFPGMKLRNCTQFRSRPLFMQSTQSDCTKSCSKKENCRLELFFCWNMHDHMMHHKGWVLLPLGSWDCLEMAVNATLQTMELQNSSKTSTFQGNCGLIWQKKGRTLSKWVWGPYNL